MEITRFIQTLETLQSDVEKATLSAIEKDILRKKLAALYERLLLETPIKTSADPVAVLPEKVISPTVTEAPKTELQEEPVTTTVTTENTHKADSFPIEPKEEVAITTKSETPIIEAEKTAINAEIPTVQKPLSEEKPGHSLLDLKTEKSSLNERFQQNAPSLNERLQQNDLRKMLDFNRTILFTTELFGKDSVAFGKAIDKLNASQSIQEAFAYLNNEIIHQYKWKPESESVKLFEKIVRQKFGLQ